MKPLVRVCKIPLCSCDCINGITKVNSNRKILETATMCFFPLSDRCLWFYFFRSLFSTFVTTLPPSESGSIKEQWGAVKNGILEHSDFP